MKRLHVRTLNSVATPIIMICLLLSLPFIPACEETTKTTHPSGPSGSLVGHDGCKQFPEGPTGTTFAPVQDCLLYDYDGVGVLSLRHANAGFNCCPGEITADITIVNSVITIVESEAQSGCHCLCLFDLDYEFEDLDPGTYTIRVVEPYADAEDDPLVCTIDLSGEVEGNCCVDRDHYPWDTGSQGGPVGELIGYSGCKAMLIDGSDEEFADIDCIEYEYINDNVLLLTHINAGFNCCPEEITADIIITGNVITITESEEGAFCDCDCLFDLEYEIMNLPPGTYVIRVIEPYTVPGEEPLEFTADLEANPIFRYCVDRNHYPWHYTNSEQEDLNRLKRLKQRIVAIIGTPHCTGNDVCRSIAFGDKPCGGPWEYLVYSTESTNVELLVKMVCAYNALNHILNMRHGWISDCMIVDPPRIGCVEGVCVDLDRNH